jgi:hypothetical protein
MEKIVGLGNVTLLEGTAAFFEALGGAPGAQDIAVRIASSL